MVAVLTIGLRVKKETIGEVAAAATVTRGFAIKVDVPAEVSDYFVDIVDTGGDGASTSNISTVSMFVAAAADARVVKHGGRGVSSKPGSTDVLKALGVNIMLTPEQAAESIETIGIGFMFAFNYHLVMKNVASIRKELGVCTIFNTLGSLTNPAGASNTLMGMFYPDLVDIQMRVIQWLGTKHAVVVYGKDGTNEVSLGAATLAGELKDGVVTGYEIHPKDLELQMVSNRGLKVADTDESKTIPIEAPGSKPGTPHEIASLNAGAALYAANTAGLIGDGMKLAREAIVLGAARVKLDELVRVTNQFKV